MRRSAAFPNQQQQFNIYSSQGPLSPTYLPKCRRPPQIQAKSSKQLFSTKSQGLVGIPEISANKRLESGKNLMNEYLNQAISEASPNINQQKLKEYENILHSIQKIDDFEEYIEKFFELYNRCLKKILIQNEKKIIKIPTNLKLKKSLLLNKQPTLQKNKKELQMQMISRQNQQLKRQLFRLKQSTIDLQKRILNLVVQYKERKTIYITEIQRLATIVDTSIRSIPQLLLNQQHPESRKAYFSAEKPKSSRQMIRKESEYNTVSSMNEPLNVGMDAIFKVFQESRHRQKSSSSHRRQY